MQNRGHIDTKCKLEDIAKLREKTKAIFNIKCRRKDKLTLSAKEGIVANL